MLTWVSGRGVDARLTICGAVDSVQDRRAGRGKTCCLWLFRHPAYWGISSVGRASGWQPEGQGFESPILHSACVHHLAPGRKPLQNRDFFMRGQSGLRPRARQYGRLLQRFFTVVVGPLEVVLLRDCRAVADPLTDDVHGEVFGEFPFNH